MCGFVILMFPRMTPLTSNTTIRGPSAAHASARLPFPEALRLVTLMTFPPRPPTLTAPHPSAPGKALRGLPPPSGRAEGQFSKTASSPPQAAAPTNLAFIMDPLQPHREQGSQKISGPPHASFRLLRHPETARE